MTYAGRPRDKHLVKICGRYRHKTVTFLLYIGWMDDDEEHGNLGFFVKRARQGPIEAVADRIGKHGYQDVSKEELLTVVLAYTQPTEEDARTLADDLLEKFGSLGKIIAADDIELRKVPRMNQGAKAQLKLAKGLIDTVNREQVTKVELGSYSKVTKYLKTYLGQNKTESFRALLLDNQNDLIGDIELSNGTVDHVPVYIREIIGKIYNSGASCVVLVHNHPYMRDEISNADIIMTKQIIKALKTIDVRCYDHLIVNQNGITSFLDKGIMYNGEVVKDYHAPSSSEHHR